MKASKLGLVAAAVLATLAVPAMAADVSIYGRAHLSVDHLDNGVDSGVNVSSNSSRLGFKASTKLEDDMEVFVQLEQNIRFDEGSGSFATRDSFVGLKGNFGMARIGFFDTPLKTIRSRTDMFGDRIGDARNITSGYGQSFDNRYRNGVHYRTPNMNGFTVDFQYTPHNNTGATVQNDRESYSTSLTYTSKGIYVAAAYESYEGTDGVDPNALRLGAYYDINSDLRVSALYQKASDVANGDRSVYGVGASYKMGDYTLRGQYYVAGDADADNSGANMLVLGADRKLGKDLTLYLAYGITSNDDNANYTIASGGRDTRLTAIAGENSAGLSFGVVYSF
ncbi:porin [Arsukibacterium ikkense]|uniref:Porin n=1 Tax=Arsukibacterium ikkense TaxID=336831 RepID=A0A0M2V3P3_9GAMM|nr:porin [Arsukibacterium ikkense]KKO45477.1 porin [Arsukibacterium ikkense]